jgi:hypothetical protein
MSLHPLSFFFFFKSELSVLPRDKAGTGVWPRVCLSSLKEQRKGVSKKCYQPNALNNAGSAEQPAILSMKWLIMCPFELLSALHEGPCIQRVWLNHDGLSMDFFTT